MQAPIGLNRVAGVLAAVAATGLVTACGVTIQASTDNQERSYDVGGQISTVKVSSEHGRVEVVGADTGTVRVTERLSYNSDSRRPKTEHPVDGGVLSLRYSCPGGLVIGHNSCGVTYRVTVPRGTAVEVSTTVGEVKLAGLSGTVKAKSEVGEILATDLRGAQVTVGSEVGDIRLTGSAKAAELHSMAGDVTAVYAAAPDQVTARTESGSVRLTLPDQPYAVDASTSSGDRQIGVVQDPRATRRVTVRTESGTISVARNR